MLAGYAYPAIVVLVVLTTVPLACIVARVAPYFPLLIGYLAGFACGVLIVVAERYLINEVKWDDILFVLLLPGVGIAVASIWPTASVRNYRRTRRFLAIALLLVAAAFVYGEVKLQPESVAAPFEAGRKGSVVEVQFRVPATYAYSFFLDLHFKEGDHQDRDRVRRLAGTGARDRQGRPIDTGLAIPVRLILEHIDGSTRILDNTFTDHELVAYGFDHYEKRITRMRLEAGRYRARIEALDNIPDLEGVPVRFAVGIPGNE